MGPSHLNVSAAKAELKAAAEMFASHGISAEDDLCMAAIRYAAAKRRRNNSRDAWKRKHRLGELP
jgi:hypothetical protein